MEPTPRAVGGIVWAKHVVTWIVALLATGLFLLLLAVPLGISLVGFVPIGIAMILCGWLYFGWRNYAMRRGAEPTARAGYARLVGGAVAREEEERQRAHVEQRSR